jgi:AdoMet-dependent heme synthase
MPVCEAHPIVMWELTRPCDERCRNCTTGAPARQDSNEMPHEAYRTVDQIASLTPREFIIAGADALDPEEVVRIIHYARHHDLDPTLAVSPSSKLTAEDIGRLVRHGLTRIVFSIEGSTPRTHYKVHGVAGTFESTLRSLRRARDAGLAVEVSTTITRGNVNDLAGIADLIRPVGISRWNLRFLIPMTASARSEMLVAAEAEGLFSTIEEIRERESFAVRVIGAPHYRRYRLQRALEAGIDHATVRQWPSVADTEREVMDSAVDDARGFLFISHAGDVRAGEFLLFSAGNLRHRPLDAIYCSSDLFVALRDPDNLKGRCGRCEFRHICGGSRARALAIKDNIFADDPLCAYQPGSVLPNPAALRQTEVSS